MSEEGSAAQPKEIAALQPKSVSIRRFIPDGSLKPTQVHVWFDFGGGQAFALRFNSAQGAQRFAVELVEAIAATWPDSELAREWRS